MRLLELSEKDALLEDKPVKQFVMDLSNPRQGATLGRHPRTTVTITDLPGEQIQMGLGFLKDFNQSDWTFFVLFLNMLLRVHSHRNRIRISANIFNLYMKTPF